MNHFYLINLPHCATAIPEAYLKDYYLSDKELQENVHQYADLYTDEIYKSLYETFGGVKAKYSRLFCDLERFFDDNEEEMHIKHNLGWFYTNAILSKKPLRHTENKEAISEYYRDYHNKLNTKASEKLEHYGRCTVIDCHSFSNERYWFHDKDIELPDICIGYDETFKDQFLLDTILKEFEGYKIGINEPYAGSLVPMDYYRENSPVKSVMIEINKKLYLEPDNVTKSSDFELIRSKIANITKILAQG